MPKIFDSHCHILTDSIILSSSYPSQHPQNFFLNVTTKKNEWLPAIYLGEHNRYVLASLGLHPWFVDRSWMNDINFLAELLSTNKVSSIGEIGLDYVDEFIGSKSLQLDAFKAHTSLAEKYGLPVSLHCRKAFDGLYLVLKRSKVTGVLHGFSSSYELAQQFIDLGFKIGVGGLLLSLKSKKLERTVKNIKLTDMVVETDYPNFVQLGKGLELADISLIIERIAQIKSLDLSEVKEILYNNAAEVFLGSKNAR